MMKNLKIPTSREMWHQQILFLLALVYMLILPFFPPLLSLVILLMGINAIAGFRYRYYFRQKNNPLYVLLSLGFYAIYVLSFLINENRSNGILEMETKLSFLLLPLILACSPRLKASQVRRIFEVFALACLISGLICLGQSLYHYILVSPHINFLQGPRFSIFLHRSFFALYLNVALAFVISRLSWYGGRVSGTKKHIMALSAIFFVIFIVMTGSKAGFIVLLFLLLLWLFYSFRQLKIWKLVLLLLMAGSFIFLALTVSPIISVRFDEFRETMSEQKIDKTSINSTTVRLVAWRVTWDIARESQPLGLGPGNLSHAMTGRFEEGGYENALQMNINSAHNQWLESLAEGGIFGLFVLISLFVYPAVVAIRNRRWFLLFVAVIFLSFSLTESIFEIFKGIAIFHIVTGLLLLHPPPFIQNKEEL